MIKLYSILTFLAFSLCAAAQFTTNVPGVTLSGPVADPTIVNHSGKTVIAAMVVLMPANGHRWAGQRLFTHDRLGLPDGESELVGVISKRQLQTLESPIVSGTITAVIFVDGELRGVDSDDFQANMERHLQSMRNVWLMAKAGNWAGVQAKADAGNYSQDHSAQE